MRSLGEWVLYSDNRRCSCSFSTNFNSSFLASLPLPLLVVFDTAINDATIAVAAAVVDAAMRCPAFVAILFNDGGGVAMLQVVVWWVCAGVLHGTLLLLWYRIVSYRIVDRSLKVKHEKKRKSEWREEYVSRASRHLLLYVPMVS